MTTSPNPATVAKALTPATNTLLLAMANAQLLREEIDGYTQEVLDAGSYTSQYDDSPITKPKDSWTMGEESFPAYYALVEAKFRGAGHDPPPECCPALVAEDLQRKAEWALIEASEPFFGVTNSGLLCCKNGLERRQKFIDLCIGLCVNYPGYEKPAIPGATA